MVLIDRYKWCRFSGHFAIFQGGPKQDLIFFKTVDVERPAGIEVFLLESVVHVVHLVGHYAAHLMVYVFLQVFRGLVSIVVDSRLYFIPHVYVVKPYKLAIFMRYFLFRRVEELVVA